MQKKKTRSKIASSSPPFCKQQCVLSGVNEKTDRFLRKSPLERGLMEEERGGRQASLHVVIKRTRRQARAPRNRNPKPARIIIYSSRCASLLDVAWRFSFLPVATYDSWSCSRRLFRSHFRSRLAKLFEGVSLGGYWIKKNHLKF